MKVTQIMLWPVHLQNPDGESLFLFPESNKIIFQSWHGCWSKYSPIIDIFEADRWRIREKRLKGGLHNCECFICTWETQSIKRFQMLDLSTADSVRPQSTTMLQKCHLCHTSMDPRPNCFATSTDPNRCVVSEFEADSAGRIILGLSQKFEMSMLRGYK